MGKRGLFIWGMLLTTLLLHGQSLRINELMSANISILSDEDGAYVEAGENDNLIVQKLEANPNAMGIFGFSFLDQNADKIHGAQIDGVAPTFDAIADGSYPVSRPLYFYVKAAHANKIPGIKEYLKAFTSERAWGPDGYLSDKGLIPMPDDERKTVASNVKGLTGLTVSQLK